MTSVCDRLFVGGLVFLIFFTPFAFGAVQPWAYTVMEVVIFALVIVWMIKLMIVRRQGLGVRRTPNINRLTPYALPLTLFIAVSTFQLVPLPPELLRIVSPKTYETYRQILPGWPDKVPYGDLSEIDGQRSQVSSKGPEVGSQSWEQRA